MAKVSSEDGDPDQLAARAMFTPEQDENAPPPPPKDIVIDGDEPNERDTARRGDRKISSERAPPNPPRDTPRARPEEGVEELQRQRDRERAMRERAEQAATQALARANQAEARYAGAAGGMIDSAMEAATRQSQQAEARYIAALDISDHQGAAKAQTELADARYNLLRLQEQKQAFQDDADRRKQQAEQQPQGDNLSRITGQLEKTGYRKSAQWLREHPDMIRDQEAINRVDGAHSYLVNVKKIAVESDRYFDEMERILLDGEEPSEPEPEPAPRATRREQRSPPMSAPVSRSAPNLRTGKSGRTVTLTSEQRQHAHEVLGMTDEEYARELAWADDNNKLLGTRR